MKTQLGQQFENQVNFQHTLQVNSKLKLTDVHNPCTYPTSNLGLGMHFHTQNQEPSDNKIDLLLDYMVHVVSRAFECKSIKHQQHTLCGNQNFGT